MNFDIFYDTYIKVFHDIYITILFLSIVIVYLGIIIYLIKNYDLTEDEWLYYGKWIYGF